MNQESFIHYKKHVIHYVKAGNGKHALLVFHGFGQDHTLYVTLLKSLSKKYTLYIIDLFFHGKSEWNEGEAPLKKSTWVGIVDVLLHEQRIQAFSIMAYSLGGKFALATLEAYPQKIKKVFLIAPDGIKTSFWYSLATYPGLFRNFFKSMILHPQRFSLIARKLNQLSLVDKGLIRFADFQMNSEAKRKRVYYSWVVFRQLKFDLKIMGNLINRQNIQLTMVVGKYDKVIRTENMDPLLKHVHQYRLEIMECGHSELVNQSLQFLIEAD